MNPEGTRNMGEQLSEANRALIERVLGHDEAEEAFMADIFTSFEVAVLLQAARSEGPHPDQFADAGKMVPHPESGEWVMVPRQPSYKLVSDLASEWAYSTEEASESYQGFLDVVSRHGAAGSDPAAYESDRLADEEGDPPPLEGAGRGEDGSSRSQPVLSPESDNADGWISWKGGEQPVADDVKVDLKFSDGDSVEGSMADRWNWGRGDGWADPEITHYRLSDGALGRQDEVVQPIRDAPISSSKWEALPVVSEEMVEAFKRFYRERGVYLNHGNDNHLHDALTAALSLPRPASDKGEEAPVAWTGSGSLRALELGGEGFIWPEKAKAHPIPLYARPSPGVSREEVAALVSERLDQFASYVRGEKINKVHIVRAAAVLRSGVLALLSRGEA